MENSLDEILNEPTPEPQAEAPQEPILDETSGKADPPSDRVRDDKGRFAKKETGVTPDPAAAEPAPSEAPPAPSSSQLPREVYEPLKVVRDENKELKRRLEQMEQMLRRPAPQTQQPPVDFWDNPQAFMASEFSRFGETLMQQFEQRQRAQRIDASEQAARAKYADYDDALAAFETAVQANPRLAVEMSQAPDPGEYAYSRGKTALTLSQVGSLDDLKAQIRAELEAEVKAVIQPAPRLPSTTAADGSVGARRGPEWSGPTPLKQILG